MAYKAQCRTLIKLIKSIIICSTCAGRSEARGKHVNKMQTGGMDDSTSTSCGVGDSEPEPPAKRHKADQQLYDFINDDGDYAQTTQRSVLIAVLTSVSFGRLRAVATSIWLW